MNGEVNSEVWGRSTVLFFWFWTMDVTNSVFESGMFSRRREYKVSFGCFLGILKEIPSWLSLSLGGLNRRWIMRHKQIGLRGRSFFWLRKRILHFWQWWRIVCGIELLRRESFIVSVKLVCRKYRRMIFWSAVWRRTLGWWGLHAYSFANTWGGRMMLGWHVMMACIG